VNRADQVTITSDVAVFLIDNPALVPVLVLLIAAVSFLAGYLILRAHRQWALWTLAVLSIVPVVALTLVPTPRRMDEVPFCTLDLTLPTLTSVEMVANVALLFPVVFFTALATRRPALILGAGIGLSAAIEICQALVPALGRACDSGGWVMNSVGAIFAALLASATIALAERARV
jgi:hypothetical protein